jgi:hypothetical protein
VEAAKNAAATISMMVFESLTDNALSNAAFHEAAEHCERQAEERPS